MKRGPPRSAYKRAKPLWHDGSDTEVIRRVGRLARPWRTLSHDSPWIGVLLRDPCSWCGAKADSIDHVTPYRTGGPSRHTTWNSTAACRDCNSRRGHLSVLAFLAALAGMLPAPSGLEVRLPQHG